MCVVSMVHDYYRDRTGPVYPIYPGGTNLPAIPSTDRWDGESVRLLKEAIDKLEQLDKRLGDRECKDPEKTKWLLEIEERLKKLEGGNT